jgi:serralysin
MDNQIAIWLLPDDNSWPPEIDMLEVVGQHQDLIFVNAHGSGRTMTTHQVSSITDDWYVVGFLWTPTTMRWTINGKVVREHPNFITGKNLYMLMSWEIGSNWPGKPNGSTKWPAEVLVDYVRIYRSDSSS